MAAISAKPFVEEGIQSRRIHDKEHYMGGPTMLCKDTVLARYSWSLVYG